MKKLLVLIFIPLLIGACSFHMEKRRYNKGFHLTVFNATKKQLPPPRRLENNKVAPVSETGKIISENKNHIRSTIKPLVLQENNSLLLINPPQIKHEKKKDIIASEHNGDKSSITVTAPSDAQQHNRRDNNWLLWISGIFIGGFATLFRFFIPHTKALGYWALNNRKAARGMHFLAHCGVAASGYYLGKQLYYAGISGSGTTLYSLAGFASMVSLLYPVRKVKHGIFRNTYFKQKMYALLMTASGLMLFVTAGNLNASGHLGKAISNHSFIQTENFKDQNIAAEDPLPEKKKRSTGVNVMLTVLTAILSLALCVLITVGSCALTCSGQGALAVMIAVVGFPLVILLSIHLIKKIWGMEGLKKSKILNPK